MGTRPEAIKLAPVILAAYSRPHEFMTTVVNLGQHDELADAALRAFGIQAQHRLRIMRHCQTPTDVIANVLKVLPHVLADVGADILLVQGDTSSALAAALAAYHLKIPVGHVEAGLRTAQFYTPFPEEMNRRLISRLATFHFAPTVLAQQHLLSEGVSESLTIITGNPGIDALQMLLSQAVAPVGLVPSLYDPHSNVRMLVLTCHRRENHGPAVGELCKAVLRIVSAFPDLYVVCPLHPNPAVAHDLADGLSNNARILLLPSLEYPQFLWLIRRASLILTDSGGIQEEAPALGKPLIVVRSVTERQEGVQCGAAALVGTEEDAIVFKASDILKHPDKYAGMCQRNTLYGDGRASGKILDFVAKNMGPTEGRATARC